MHSAYVLSILPLEKKIQVPKSSSHGSHLWVLGSCDLPILEQIKITSALRVGMDFSTVVNNRDGQSKVVSLLIRDEGLVPPDQPQQDWSSGEIRQCENSPTGRHHSRRCVLHQIFWFTTTYKHGREEEAFNSFFLRNDDCLVQVETR